MGDKSEDMDIEMEQNDNKLELSEKKIRQPNFRVIEELKKLGSSRSSSKRKKIGILIVYNFGLIITNTIKLKTEWIFFSI